MRALLVVGVIVCATAAPSGLQGLDVHGVVRVSGRPQANAVVWLESSGAPPSRTGKIVLNQQNLTFSPRVLAVRVGSTVEFPNNDRVFHNVFSFRDGKVFNLGIYPVGTVRNVTFDKPGLSRLFCNIHPNMAAYIMAIDSPYFAVSDETGAFTIRGVPPGTYTYRTWRSGGDISTGTFEVGSERRLEVDRQ
jgi:plastocyanin